MSRRKRAEQKSDLMDHEREKKVGGWEGQMEEKRGRMGGNETRNKRRETISFGWRANMKMRYSQDFEARAEKYARRKKLS